jgi:hypothetical protein
MTLKSYLLSMLVATLLCWTSWIFTVYTVNPLETNKVGFYLFYGSLALSLMGTGAVVGFVIRFIFLKHHVEIRQVSDAVRQSFLFSFLIIVSLALLSKSLFSWFNLFFLMTGLTILELFLVSYRRSR